MPKANFNDPDQRQNATAQVLQRILSDNAALRIENQRLFNYAQQLEAEIAELAPGDETTAGADPPEPAADAAPAEATEFPEPTKTERKAKTH